MASKKHFPIRIGNSQFSSIYRSKFTRGYEVEIQLLILSETNQSRADALFVDVGCNWGHHSFDAILSGNFSVQAFDANPNAIEDFIKIAKALGLSNRANVAQFAITDTNEGHASLRIPILKSGMASTKENWIESKTLKSRATILFKKLFKVSDPLLRVPNRTIDALKLANVKILKIDIEGADSECLVGARRTIKKQRPAIVVEWQKEYGHQSKGLDIVEFLYLHQYNFFRFDEKNSGLAKVNPLEITSRQNILILQPEQTQRLRKILGSFNEPAKSN